MKPQRQHIKWLKFLTVLLVLLLISPATMAGAQAGDSDGDGVPDSRDRCPLRPGPLDNDGCPEDTDGDGVLDDVDQCIDQAGPADNNGCPVDAPDVPAYDPNTADGDQDGVVDALDFCDQQPGPAENGGCPLLDEAPAAPAAQPLPNLPPLGAEGERCIAATQGYEAVNLREWPNLLAPVIGTLDPFSTYPVLMLFSTPEGDWLRTYGGWFAAFVTRQGGDCDALPQMSTSALNPTFGPQMTGAPAYADVAGLQATLLACDGAVHGVLFSSGEVEAEVQQNEYCRYTFGPDGAGVQLNLAGSLSYGGPDTAPLLSWESGSPADEVSGIDPTPFAPSLPGGLFVISGGPGEVAQGGGTVGVVVERSQFKSASLNTDALPEPGALLGDVIPQPVWEGVFMRAMSAPEVEGAQSEELSPAARAALQNFGLSACDGPTCLTAVAMPNNLLDTLSAPGECFTVGLTEPHMASLVSFDTPYNCGFGYQNGTALTFHNLNGKFAPWWSMMCSAAMGTPFLWSSVYAEDTLNVTVDWGDAFEGYPIHCSLSIVLLPN